MKPPSSTLFIPQISLAQMIGLTRCQTGRARSRSVCCSFGLPSSLAPSAVVTKLNAPVPHSKRVTTHHFQVLACACPSQRHLSRMLLGSRRRTSFTISILKYLSPFLATTYIDMGTCYSYSNPLPPPSRLFFSEEPSRPSYTILALTNR
jgi:hypothetical protein